MPEWKDPAGPLKRLAEALGMGPVAFAEYEHVDDLTYIDKPFDPASDVGAVFLEMRDKYGPALVLIVKIGTQVLLRLDANYGQSQLDLVLDKIKAGNLPKFDLRIDKQKLLPYWGFRHDSIDFKIFLFPGALVLELEKPLPVLDHDPKGLLRNATGTRKIVILVPEKDHQLELDGDYLALLTGEEAVARWAEKIPKNDRAKAALEVKSVRDQAVDRVRWVQFDLEHLTPLHLNVTGEVEPAKDDPIAGALYAQLFACSLLYTAGRAIWNGADGRHPLWTATFSSDKDLATFDIGTAAALRPTLAAQSAAPWETARLIGDRVPWIYKSDHVADRLSVLQSVIASSLQDNSAAANPGELAGRAKDIIDRVESGWTTFVKRTLERYFEQVRALESLVAEAAKAYGDEVQSLTKTLVDNMLAAVAVVVGSFIAAMFQRPFQAYVFWFGVIVYIVYLVVFPIGVGLVSACQRFRKMKDAFDERKKDFVKRLTAGEVRKIVNTAAISRGEKSFRVWFGWTAALYGVVLAVVVALMIIVPREIERRSDNFDANDAQSGTPAGNVVPLVIRGANFDREKEIVVTVGGLKFTNAGSESVKVLGSSVLTLSVPAQPFAVARKSGFISVQQGRAPPRNVRLR